MKIAKSIKDLIGKTPILEIEKNIFAKCEFLNPLGSIKDRVALNILEEALKKQQIKAGDTIIEATSGNTGIALSAIGASLNLKVVIVMPESMSAERISLMKYFGAEVILTEAKKGMTGAIEKTQEILNSIPNSFLVSQFENPDNPNAHFKTTAVEIWEDFPEIDIFVSAVGTGGTISGVGRFLKSKNPKIKIIGVEPHQIKNHKIQGIGAGFTPKTLDLTIVDEFVKITMAKENFKDMEIYTKKIFKELQKNYNLGIFFLIYKDHIPPIFSNDVQRDLRIVLDRENELSVAEYLNFSIQDDDLDKYSVPELKLEIFAEQNTSEDLKTTIVQKLKKIL